MSGLKESEREEIELLLPWYVNGTLDPESVARVESALRSDPSLARSLALLEEDREAVLALAQAEEAPESMERRFLAQLDAASQRAAAPARRQKAGILSRLGDWIDEAFAGMAPRGLALAAAAAGLVVLLQAGIIASMLGGGADRDAGFQTASGEDAAGGPAVLVQFGGDVSMTEISAVLDELGAQIVEGPLPGGMFKLRFDETEQRRPEEVAAVLRERSEYFRLALPSE